ncbi:MULTISPECIES: hypothetical protein [Spongiibacter]|uniref:DoxX family protein n=1 Tax=Spongiibacter TaxID=630749 RepID=UPI000C3A737E|nr:MULTISPECIES: hypothetical protein [Spongiibacter]MBO6753948.1 hypothetical protein [Spongiibacter sp.]MBU71362.1 hypothetical protein [Spongiibacter sp.]
MKNVIRVLICLFFLGGGVAHFLVAEGFAAIVPPFLPWPLAIVWLTGVAELIMAPMVFWPRYREPVGKLMALYCLLVLPANIYQAISGVEGVGGDLPESFLWLRIPLQFVLIAAILWATTDNKRATDL